MNKTELWLEETLVGKSYETVVSLYTIGNLNRDEIWFAIPKVEASATRQEHINNWIKTGKGESVFAGSKVYGDISSGTLLRVTDVRWVENPAVARFEVLVDVLGDHPFKGLQLQGCFELGNSGVPIERVSADRHLIASDADLGYLHVNSNYLRPSPRNRQRQKR